MEIWLDTANIDLIKKAKQLGILHGVTTNPSILAKENREPSAILNDILKVQSGPVTAQVMSEDCRGMMEEADYYQSISKRILVKIPVTQEGLKAIHQLSRQSIPTMATVIFHPNQALLAALAGADYVAPYVGRMESAGENAFEMLESMSKIFANYHFETKILAASIKDTKRVNKCAEIGIHAVTLKDEVFNMLIGDNELTLQSLAQFSKDGEFLVTTK